MGKARIDWWTPVMGGREKELLAEVIDRGFPNDGEYTTAFENKIAKMCEVPYAIAVTSGTIALFLGLAACGIGPGDEVLVPDITFIATAYAVKLTGATPVFVDVDRETFCLDPAIAEQKVSKRTRAIIPVHISGRGANMEAIGSLALRHKLHVVEDAAEALGSRRGRALGTFGDVGCLSFTATKLITTGQGGMVITANPEIHTRLRELKDQGRPVRGSGGDDSHPGVGYNFKLTNLQAAMGLAQLETFRDRCEHQRSVYEIYAQRLHGSEKIRVCNFQIDSGEQPLWVDAVVEGRDELNNYLRRHDIFTRNYWFPLHTQPVFAMPAVGFENSVEISRRALWLPSGLTLAQSDVHTICDVVERWAEGK